MTVDLLERCLTVFTTGLHTADPLTLDHEAERVETMPSSPLAERMRAAVDAERAEREHAHTYGMPCPVPGCRWPAPGGAR